MKYILIALLIVVLGIFAFLKTTGGNSNIAQAEGSSNMTDKKVLIAYFSYSGNTKSIAEKIQAKVGGDIFRIEVATPYPTDYNETAYGIAKKQHDENILPELKDNGDVSAYDVVFVGTPAWWYEMAPAVKTFFANNNFEGKTVIPFITHGGGGKYHIKEDMQKMTKDAQVIEPFVVYEKGNANTDKELSEWLKELGF